MIYDLISVIIPVYNVEKYIKIAVESVITQSYKKIELILVDDGSTDSSGELCDNMSLNDSRIKVIRKKNGGLSDARNVGIENSNGNYLFFLDSDDFIDQDCLLELFEPFKSNQIIDIVSSNLVSYNDFNQKIERIYNLNNKKGIYSSSEALQSMLYLDEFSFSACGKLFKRKLFETIKFEKGKYWEDMGCIPWVFKQARSVYLIDKDLYFYRNRTGSICRGDVSRKLLTDYIEVGEKIYDLIRYVYPENIKAAESIYTTVLMDAYLRSYNSENDVDDIRKICINEIIKYRKNIIKDKKCRKHIRIKCFVSLLGFDKLIIANNLYKKIMNVLKIFIAKNPQH